MRHSNTVLGIGIFLILITLLGIPSAWKNFFTVFSGLVLCGASFAMRNVGTSNGSHSHAHKRHGRKIHVLPVTHIEPISETQDNQVYPNTHEQPPTV